LVTKKGENLKDKLAVMTIYGAKGKTILRIGKEYIIQPLNPLKKKHRNRRCIVLDFVPVSESHPIDIVAKVRFVDNNRIGRTELDDLVSPRRSRS
jgi:hypothetical protein